MGLTMTQKILRAKTDAPTIEAGDLIECRLDLLVGNDITTPPAIDVFEQTQCESVFASDAVVLVPDHFAPNKDIKSATQCQKMRDFAIQKGIRYYYELGEKDMGIEHVIVPENGLVAPGDIVIGADSHTCTYGALGAFSTGVGSTDLACAMATGKTWFRVPEAIKISLIGVLPPHVSGKDVILSIIGKIGVDGALYQSLEFSGEGVGSLSMADRFTICNMAIEAGAKNGIFPVDDIALAYMREFCPDRLAAKSYEVFTPDEDAVYASEYTIDLSQISFTVAFPHLPSNTKTIGEFDPVKIQQVVIGSCTNGRVEDLEVAAEVFRGRQVKKGVRAIIIPGSQRIYKKALQKGLIDIFIDANCVVSAPTCGPCLGGHMGILADGEACLSTTNRNFVGRMGHKGSKVYLGSPYVAACSAVLGEIGILKEGGENA